MPIGLLVEVLEAFLHGIGDRPGRQDRVAEARRELGERVLEGDLKGPLAGRLDAGEAVPGGARFVGADDRLEDVGGRAGDPVLGVGDGIPAGHEVLRRDFGVHRRLEVDALPDGEREDLRVGADLGSRCRGRARCSSWCRRTRPGTSSDPRRSGARCCSRYSPGRCWARCRPGSPSSGIVVRAAGLGRAAGGAGTAAAATAAGSQDEGERHQHDACDERPPRPHPEVLQGDLL